jgi:hypothetical protein
MEFEVKVASEDDHKYAQTICDEMEASAKARGTGIAKRSPEYLKKQMSAGKAVIAMNKATKEVAGFCYIESWQGKKYTANSGLIVFPQYRQFGLARRIKNKAFELSRSMFPEAKLFGLTTNAGVMKINSELGYRPTTFSELTDDVEFWKGCQSCVNYAILESKQHKNCLCTAMIFDPEEKKKSRNPEDEQDKNLSLMEKIRLLKSKWFSKD